MLILQACKETENNFLQARCIKIVNTKISHILYAASFVGGKVCVQSPCVWILKISNLYLLMYNSPKKPSRLKKQFSELTAQSFAIIMFNLIVQMALNIKMFFNPPFLSPYIPHTDMSYLLELSSISSQFYTNGKCHHQTH